MPSKNSIEGVVISRSWHSGLPSGSRWAG